MGRGAPGFGEHPMEPGRGRGFAPGRGRGLHLKGLNFFAGFDPHGCARWHPLQDRSSVFR